MRFSYDQKREACGFAQRSVTMGSQGMVASSQHLATLSGYKALWKGGNAVDAAVAMVSTLSVVEPHSVGIGGDAFALIHLPGRNTIIGMNGSGGAPERADLKYFRQRNMTAMPERGMLTVTVPGALHGWAEAMARYGTLKLADVFEDAIYYAEHGFPVTELIAGEWGHAEDILLPHGPASKTYLMHGKAPKPGKVFKNKDLAKTYRQIAAQGIETFYKGDICKAIVDFSEKNRGLLCRRDFENHTTRWVDPISTDYRGYTIYELPPNGQGLAALEMLNILEGYDIGGMGHNNPQYLHHLIEAKKIAFRDRDLFITDPDFESIPVDRLVSKDYAENWRARIDDRTAMDLPTAIQTAGSDTVFVTAIDRDRNAVSFISSIFMAFGSGVVVEGTGIVLQNRGNSFSLDPEHPNRLEPRKRPMHTIIPAMVFKDGKFVMSFGVVGGDMQPQGQVQLLVNLIDFKMNLQEAVDAPRIRHFQGKAVYLESGIPESTASVLQGKGHDLMMPPAEINQVGGGQAIYLDRSQDVLLGASDRRKDGCAIGY